MLSRTKELGGAGQGIQPNGFPCCRHTLLVGFSDFCLLSMIGIILNAIPRVEVTN